MSGQDLPPPVGKRSPAFLRMMLALVAAGFSTFALLYSVQPLLPLYVQDFHRTPAQASLAISVATGALAGSILFSGMVADRVERRRMMFVSLIIAGGLGLAAAWAPSWGLLLLARGLTGFALSGVPAVALTYIAEEIEPQAVGLAVGLHIGGNVFGGMMGRLAVGVLADRWGWRVSMTAVAVAALLAAVLLQFALPASRRFRPRHRSLGAALTGFAGPFRDKGMPWMFLLSFTCMGCFVTVYNYIGFRLLAPPYSLSQTHVGLIFALYLLGVFSSPLIGDLAGRLGRGKVLWATIAVMAAGVAMTFGHSLYLVIGGLAVTTFAYFGTHAVGSSWVGQRAGAQRAQASSIYLFCYYLGASVIGYFGGVAWSHSRWPGVAWMLEILLLAALAVSIGLAFLKPLPLNQAAAAQKPGS